MPQAYPLIWAAAVAAAKQIVITMALAMLQKTLQKKPGRGSFATNVTIRSTISERHMIIGTMRASGTLDFRR